ncbi:hypothetical protein llap_19691 [Limosa lapponica baueri]|uniref:Uncharacterized protein n=1 Tax=Limosa lapponica baueri TaxID=1758121 RepID=A0A2I0T872_LIMLA|nr:hypothetical protein llap_19691 [Limosa lapponica baueri]
MCPCLQLVREEEEEEGSDQEASPSAKKREEEVREIRQEAEATQSLTSKELQDTRKDYSCKADTDTKTVERPSSWLKNFEENLCPSSPWAIALAVSQEAQMGNPDNPGILEEIMDWTEGRDFGALPEEMSCAQEAPPYKELPEDERQYALFTDGSCRVVGSHRKWKAAV